MANQPTNACTLALSHYTPAELFTERETMSDSHTGLLRFCASLDYPGDLDAARVRQYGPCGAQAYLVPNSIRPHMFGWDGSEGYSYDDYEAVLTRLRRREPGIKLLLLVGSRAGAPHRWCQRNARELVVQADGHRLCAPSLASKVWLGDSVRAIQRFVAHFEHSEFAASIVGYVPVFGSNEWRGFGEIRRDGATNETGMAFGDYSPAMQEGFREWLRRRYHNDANAIRSAWNDQTVDFATALPPSPEEREAFGDYSLLSIHERFGRKVADYFRYYNECNTEIALRWCEAIKKTTTQNAMVGIMHGFLYGWPNQTQFPQGSGHCDAARLYDSPSIDFFLSPCDENNRGMTGNWLSQHPVASLQIRSKRYVAQIDVRTHHVPPHQRHAQNAWESEQLIKRDAASALCEEAGICLADQHHPMFGHWFDYQSWGPLAYDDPALQGLLSRMRTWIDSRAKQHSPMLIQREIAVLVSSESPYYRSCEQMYGKWFVEATRQWSLPALGAPFDEYLLEDFGRIQKRYKVYVFLDALYIPASLRLRIRATLEDQGATALWFYGPGYVDESSACLDNCAEMTGMAFSRCDRHIPLQVDLTDEAVAEYGIDESQRSYGSKESLSPIAPSHREIGWRNPEFKGTPFCPVIYPDDPGARNLGFIRGLNRPGLSVVERNNATHIVSAAPAPGSDLLRGIARAAGCTIFCDTGDLINAGGNLLAITARTRGTKRLTLPCSCTLSDPLTGSRVAGPANCWQDELEKGETRLLELSRPLWNKSEPPATHPETATIHR